MLIAFAQDDLSPAALPPFAIRRIFCHVQRLDTRDVRRLVDAVAEIGSLTDAEPFPAHTITLLGELIPADSIEYSEIHHVERGSYNVGRAGDFTDGPDNETFFRIRLLFPFLTHERARPSEAMRMSDLLTLREFHRLEIYSEWYRPWHAEHTLQLCLSAHPGQSGSFGFDQQSRDFSERDRLLLDLLRPHLISRHKNCRLQRRAASSLAKVARSGADPGVLILERGGRIKFTQRSVRRLLDDYLPNDDHGFAPRRVREWIADAERADELVIDGPDGQLVVSAAGHDSSAKIVLLLHERHAGPTLSERLTRRERDVLDLVGEGKSNAEISRLLWVQPSTIRKHLENAYAKLNVNSRTQAIALVRLEAARAHLRHEP